jgi:predicted nucleotidyltransferase
MAERSTAEIVKFLETGLRAAGLRDVRVVLFGSHALGAARADSDVDVAIVSSAFSDRGAFERALMTKDVELEAMERFDAPFDILTLTPEEFDGDSLAAMFIKATSRS